jgi:hypothetical protein
LVFPASWEIFHFANIPEPKVAVKGAPGIKGDFSQSLGVGSLSPFFFLLHPNTEMCETE